MEAAATVVKQDEHVVQCVTHSHSNSSDTQSDMLTNSDCRRHSCDAVSPSTSTVQAVASSSQCSVNSDVSDVTDVTPTDLSSSPDVQIMRELNEMKAILQRLLYDKEVCVNDTGSSVNRVTSVTSANMLHELLVESTFSDNDLTLLACMRHLYPLSVSSSDTLSDETAVDKSEEIISIRSTASQWRDMDTPSEDGNTASPKVTEDKVDTLTSVILGNYEYTECLICYEMKWLYRRRCCQYAACTDCITQYFINKVQLAMISIECINIDCNDFVHRDEISLRLPKHLKGVYINLLINFNCDNLKKTCPKCNYLYSLDSPAQLKAMYKQSAKKLDASRVTCVKCEYPWCFICCAPWHDGITCKSYRKGDVALYEWARKTSQGQVNAQKCPKCKILISKSSGCDHMHCLKCKTDFCYRCGEKLRRLKFFGDHYSKLSIFGCKYRYKASKPIQRKLIRGAVFGTKLFVAPIIGSVALFTGIAIIGIGITALPFYGGVQLYRKIQNINLLESKDANNNHHNRYRIINSNVGQNKGFVSTAAQTIHVSFIDDNYVDEFYPEDTRRVT